jgi:hypothetical protein
MPDWRAQATAHERTVGEEIDAVKVVDQLTGLAHYLPLAQRAAVMEIVQEIEEGQHNQAVSAMLRPAAFRKARELACDRHDQRRTA